MMTVKTVREYLKEIDERWYYDVADYYCDGIRCLTAFVEELHRRPKTEEKIREAIEKWKRDAIGIS